MYAALGASDTVGAMSAAEGWVPKVYSRMPAGTRLLNLGESGTLLSEARRRQVPRAVAARPDVITMWLAVNDFRAFVPLELYSLELDTALSTLRASGAQVYVGNLPDISLLPWVPRDWRSFVRDEVERWNEAISVVAARHGAEVVDLFSDRSELLLHPEYLSHDGFHPSSQGYSRIADLFWEKMCATALGAR